MINPKSRSLEWITEAAQKMGVRDKALMEKTIRAFSLLEALARSGCPFNHEEHLLKICRHRIGIPSPADRQHPNGT